MLVSDGQRDLEEFSGVTGGEYRDLDGVRRLRENFLVCGNTSDFAQRSAGNIFSQTPPLRVPAGSNQERVFEENVIRLHFLLLILLSDAEGEEKPTEGPLVRKEVRVEQPGDEKPCWVSEELELHRD